MTNNPASAALSRFTVLDLTRVRAGPTCVRQLADWGADVIKVELPEKLAAGNQMGGARHGSDFQNLHRNKRSLSLNLKDPEGLEIFKRLARTADVIVENFRPDVKHRLGIDYDSLSADNPGLVYASISGFGQDGPYADRPGFDQIAQGMGGLMSITGEPGRGPMRAGIPIADLTAGLFCALGILVALIERGASGRGQWVQTSLLQAQAFMLDFQAARYLIQGELPGQAGNDHPTAIPTGVFRTADGHINIGVSGQRIWARFCEAIDRGEWMDDARFETAAMRSENRQALNALIEDVTAPETSDHWIEVFTEAGVPAGHINDIAQVFEDPQVRHLGIAQPIETGPFGATRMLAQPVTLSRTPSTLAVPAPGLGEQSDEILAEAGLSGQDIARLRDQGVI